MAPYGNKHHGLHEPARPSFTPFQEEPLQTDLWVPKRKALTCCPPQRGKVPTHHCPSKPCFRWSLSSLEAPKGVRSWGTGHMASTHPRHG